MIRYRCPFCGGLLVNSPETAGMTIACKHCRGLVEVPREGNVTSTEAERETRYHEPAEPREPIIDRIGRALGAHATEEAPPPLGVGKRMGLGCMGAFLTTIFGGLFVWVVISFVESQASQGWPSAKGVVESAEVDEKVGRTSRGRRTVEYSAAVVYKYNVQGKEYTGTQVGFGPKDNYSFMASDLAGQYRKNQEVTVYYAPSNPGNAVLRRELLFGGYVYAFVGVFAGFMGLRLLALSFMPTIASSNSRWLPWSRRVTWPDLPLAVLGAIGLVLWVPMLFGL